MSCTCHVLVMYLSCLDFGKVRLRSARNVTVCPVSVVSGARRQPGNRAATGNVNLVPPGKWWVAGVDTLFTFPSKVRLTTFPLPSHILHRKFTLTRIFPELCASLAR